MRQDYGSNFYSGLEIYKFFCSPELQNLTLLKMDFTYFNENFTKIHLSNWVLLAPGHQAMGYVEPWSSLINIRKRETWKEHLNEEKSRTSSVSVTEVWEPPDVAEAHSVAQTGEEILHFVTPCFTVTAGVAAPPPAAHWSTMVLWFVLHK